MRLEETEKCNVQQVYNSTLGLNKHNKDINRKTSSIIIVSEAFLAV